MREDYPTDTPKKLYIPNAESEYSFDDLFYRIGEHFGVDRRINEFTISVERIQTSGCSCHPEGSDFDTFIVVEEAAEPFTDTSSYTMRVLQEA